MNPRNSIDDGWNLKGISHHIRELRAEIAEEAKKPLTVLIQGPTGTGKELIARDIHNHSPRKDFPLVIVNCGAIVQDLFESELFGHEKGAFTGAIGKKRGQVELANKGTLFLDEIGDLRADHQVKLLRFLQNKTYCPVGGEKEKFTDVRVIAATNKDLLTETKNNDFRDDLYYRLSQSIIKTVPLNDRPEDIVFLLNHFASIERLEIDAKKKVLLYSYFYPGNVRQLQNYLYRKSNEIIKEWKEELIAQRFEPEVIAELRSYEDFDVLEREARSLLYYSHRWVWDGNSRRKKPAEPWAEKLLNDPNIYDWLKAIAFVGKSNGDLSKIVEAYEIITLLRSGMPKSTIVKFLQVRREKVYPEFFKENYGISLPENNEQHVESISLRFGDFPLYQAKLTELQEMITSKILKSLS
jgi:DNA-binding NtrC family response regulator